MNDHPAYYSYPMVKKPFILLPAGPIPWASYQQILPQLAKAWKKAGVEFQPTWFPRPRLQSHWVENLEISASCLIFPLGIGHYDALWTLRELREKWNSTVPAVIMLASDMTKGAEVIARYKNIFMKHDVFVTNCSSEKKLAEMVLGPEAQIKALRLPVDLELFSQLSGKARATQKKNVKMKPEAPLIVYSGRVSFQKNVHMLIEAFSLVKSHYPRAKLFIAGAYDDIGTPHLPESTRPRYMHWLAKLVTDFGLEDSVTFLGTLEQKPLSELLACCDVHVSLTVHSGEDFGYSIAQGLAAGAPTAVSLWGGGRDFVAGRGAFGIPVHVGPEGPRIHINEAVRVILELLRPEVNVRAQRNALTYAERFLSIKSVTQQWKDVFRQIHFDPRPLKIKSSLRSNVKDHRFISSQDRIYQKICRVYAGSGTAQVRKT